jgi:hypothetical protein
MPKKYVVRLAPDEHQQLIALTSTGKASARTIKHANILLLADADTNDRKDEDIAEALHCSVRTVERLRMWFVTEGLERALHRKPQDKPSREIKLDGRAQAQLTALACSEPPEGRAKWTLHLLADKMVELKIVDSISHDTVRRALKKTT